MSALRTLEWHWVRKGSLPGLLKAQVLSGMIVADVTILTGKRGPWAAPSSKQVIGHDDAEIKDANGKARYTPIIEFTSEKVRNQFSVSIVDALCVLRPEAFA